MDKVQFPPVSVEAWRQVVERDLKGASFDKRLVSSTEDGVRVQPLYVDGEPDAAGFPGLPPYARGARVLPRSWDVRERLRAADIDRAAGMAAAALQRGATSLWVELDSTARAGRDWDHVEDLPAATASGVMVSRVEQLYRLLGGIELADVALALDAGASAMPAAALLLAMARQREVDPSTLRGELCCDPLGALASDGRLPAPLDRCLGQMVDLAAWISESAPRMRSVLVSVLPYHEAGASSAQELAFALATGATYLRHLADGGLPLDRAVGQLSFRFSAGRDVFEQMAKLRAARLTWARLVQACGGNGDTQRAVIHVCTSWRTKTACDPWVNLLRTTTEGFGAAVAGADAITTTAFDEIIGTPDAMGQRIARNTQLILDREAHVTKVVDPAGGSWYVESLTRALAEQAWSLFQKLEQAGGMAEALGSGLVHQWLAEIKAQRRKDIDKRKLPITGVSMYPDVHEALVDRRAPDVTAARERVQRELAAHLSHVDQAKATAELARVCAAEVPEPGSFTEAAIEAAASGATLGRMAALLNGGDQATAIEPLPRARDAEPFEALRAVSTAHADLQGGRPGVFLANMGPIPQHRARADFASNLLQVGGLEPLSNDGHDSIEAAVDAFASSGTKAAVICSTDADYAERAADLARALKQRGATLVVLAGRPGDAEQRFRDAGIDQFIFLGCDVLAELRGMLQRLEVLK